MAEHSPEPWKVERSHEIFDADHCSVAAFAGDDAGDAYGISPEDARRIVACVNFLKGFPVETLEGRVWSYIESKPLAPATCNPVASAE